MWIVWAVYAIAITFLSLTNSNWKVNSSAFDAYSFGLSVANPETERTWEEIVIQPALSFAMKRNC